MTRRSFLATGAAVFATPPRPPNIMEASLRDWQKSVERSLSAADYR